MKITVEHYDEKVSIERENDDLSFTEFMELVRKVARGVGYFDETIDKWFNTNRYERDTTGDVREAMGSRQG
jgi:hypothetical protein